VAEPRFTSSRFYCFVVNDSSKHARAKDALWVYKFSHPLHPIGGTGLNYLILLLIYENITKYKTKGRSKESMIEKIEIQQYRKLKK
jgi:hypothetical protein